MVRAFESQTREAADRCDTAHEGQGSRWRSWKGGDPLHEVRRTTKSKAWSKHQGLSLGSVIFEAASPAATMVLCSFRIQEQSHTKGIKFRALTMYVELKYSVTDNIATNVRGTGKTEG